MGVRSAQETVTYLSLWIDNAPANAARDPEAQTWGRLAKVSEEAGEVIEAYIGMTMQNPRKGATHSKADVLEELLDTCLTALTAYEHMTGHHGDALPKLFEFILGRGKRVGVIS